MCGRTFPAQEASFTFLELRALTFWSVKAKVNCYRMRALTSRIVRTSFSREDPQPRWARGEVYTFAAGAQLGIRVSTKRLPAQRRKA